MTPTVSHPRNEACRILVTGGAGYIGSHTAKALAAAGFTPVVFDNLVYGHREAVRWGPLVTGELADGALLRRVLAEERIAAVLHFAAYAYVGESVSDPAKYFQNNAVGSLALLEAMRACGVRTIVFSSTCATYGTPRQAPIAEDHPQDPVNPYGESKRFVERALTAYATAYGFRTCALRYFNAAGADPAGELGEEHDPETHLIPLATAAALRRRGPLDLYGTDYPTPDGTAVRDYIHVADLAEAHVLALRHLLDGGEGGAFNLGTGRGHSVREVVDTVARVGGHPVPVRLCPRRPGDPPELVACSERAHRVLGWTPHWPALEDIVRHAWAWHTAHPPRP